MMIDARYKRYSSVTVRTGNGRAHGVTNVTHPFRGVTDVTVPLGLFAALPSKRRSQVISSLKLIGTPFQAQEVA